MLKIKALVFVQDESFDDDGVLHLTDLYNKKAVMMIMPRPMQSAEECIKENITKTLSKIMEDVSVIVPDGVIQLCIERGIDKYHADSTMYRTHFETGGNKYNEIQIYRKQDRIRKNRNPHSA